MIYKLILKGWKKTFKEYNILFGGMVTGSCLIYFLCLVNGISIKLYKIGGIQTNILLLFLTVSFGCGLSCFLFNRYILNIFWQKRRKDYEILDIIGISIGKLKKIVAIEEIILIFFPSLMGTMIGRMIVQCFDIFDTLGRKANIDLLDIRWCLLSFWSFMLISLVSVLLCFSTYIHTKERGYKTSFLKTLIGFAFILIAEIMFFLQSRIEITIIQIILVISGIAFIFFNVDKHRLIKLRERKEKFYYENIFLLNIYVENIKNDVRILYAAFICDFFLAYIVCGICISGLETENIQNDYPYDLIYYGTHLLTFSENQVDDYCEVPFLYISNEFVSAIVISSESYFELTGVTLQLIPNECVQIFQKNESNADSANLGKKIRYQDNVELVLKEEKNEIIFGKITQDGLGRILVVSNDTYNYLVNSLPQKYLQIFNTIEDEDLIMKEYSDKIAVIDTQEIVESKKLEAMMIVCVFMILGMILLTEIYWMIIVRMYGREKQMLDRLRLLSILGCNNKHIVKIIKSYSSQIIFGSYITSVFFSVQLFINDYISEGGGEKIWGMFACFLLLIALFQYLIFYLIVIHQVNKLKREKVI